MHGPPLAYRLVTAIARPLLPIAGLLSPRLARGVAGRLETALRVGSATQAFDSRPVIHLHAASAGELRYAEPILERLRRRHPDWRWVITHFSPSAEPFVAKLEAELHGYLPWDRPREVARFLDALAPRAALISRLDLWPAFSAAAARRRIPVILVAAGLEPGSGRLSRLGRYALGPAYRSVAAAAALGPEDVELLARLGVPRERIEVVGDPRADQVRERAAREDPARRWPALADGGSVLVAGSTWPADERLLLRAFQRVRRLHADARLVLAPHEPSPAGLDRLGRAAATLGLPSPVPIARATLETTIAVLDEVGPLASLYGVGRIAYVGGGFGRGLHSVLEPAAWGLPVLAGPRWQDSRDARRLALAGALAPLPEREAEAVLAERWERWMSEETERAAAGAAARAVVGSAAGAADRTASLVERVLRDY